MINQILRPVAQNVVRSGSRAYHPPAHFKQVTMNDIPVPKGSWQASYEAKQKKYNLHLIIGVATFVGTCVFSNVTGAIYWNWGPPTPSKEE